MPSSPPAGLLSVAEVAERLGVSGSTLRSWERRYGLAATGRTVGGHRRYTPDDVTKLLRMRRLISGGLPTASAVAEIAASPPIARRTAPVGGATAAPLDKAVTALDGRRAGTAARRVLREHGPADAWDDTFAPLLRGLGRTWERTAAGIEREHVATAAIQTELIRYATDRPAGRRGPAVVLAATQDEHHVLPLHALDASLAAARIDACLLGTVPAPSIRAAARQVGSRVIVLWALLRHPGDAAQLDAIKDAAPLVCAAGPGWQGRRLPRGVARLTDLTTTVDLVTAWSH